MRPPRLGPLVFSVFIGLAGLVAQTAEHADDWQIAAGGKLAFDVASVKKQPPGSFRPPSFPLDFGDSYNAVGGRFYADFPVATYITFAYKLALTAEQRQAMLAGLPKWVGMDVFEIEARAEGNPTKDQMRLMIQSLLADRFQLEIHFESREMPVYALALAKPGKLGPKLQRHEQGRSCEASATDIFPGRCNILAMLLRPGGARMTGARDIPMTYLAQGLPTMDSLGRPVIDRTGLSGRFDFTMEWTPETTGPAPTVIGRGGSATPVPPPPDAVTPPDGDTPSFFQALREQLGLKLESSRDRVRTLVIDHIGSPSEN